MKRDYDGEIALLRLTLAFYYIGHCVVCMDLAKGDRSVAQHLMNCHVIMWNRAWVQQWKDGPHRVHKRIAKSLERKLEVDWPEVAGMKKRQAREAGRDEGQWER